MSAIAMATRTSPRQLKLGSLELLRERFSFGIRESGCDIKSGYSDGNLGVIVRWSTFVVSCSIKEEKGLWQWVEGLPGRLERLVANRWGCGSFAAKAHPDAVPLAVSLQRSGTVDACRCVA